MTHLSCSWQYKREPLCRDHLVYVYFIPIKNYSINLFNLLNWLQLCSITTRLLSPRYKTFDNLIKVRIVSTSSVRVPASQSLHILILSEEGGVSDYPVHYLTVPTLEHCPVLVDALFLQVSLHIHDLTVFYSWWQLQVIAMNKFGIFFFKTESFILNDSQEWK